METGNNLVFIFADLNQISEINEKEGYLTVQLWVYCFYLSASAKWNASDFEGHGIVTVPANTFWTADIGKFKSLRYYFVSHFFDKWKFLLAES